MPSHAGASLPCHLTLTTLDGAFAASLDRLDQSRDDAANYKQARYFMQELNLLG